VAIIHQIRRKYATKTEETIADLAASAGALGASDPKAVLKRKTAEAAYLMALLHGGDWRVQIDHEDGLIVIARRRTPRQTRG
jgi:hypothetical protein